MMLKYNEFILEYKERMTPSQDIEDFSDLYIDKVADKIGTKVIKKLGRGSFGIAYLTKDNKVLKVTTDHNEAKNILILKDKKLKHFLNYYDIFSLSLDGKDFEEMKPQDLKFKYSYPKVKVYFIVMDYIKTVDGWKEIMWDLLSRDFFNKYVEPENFMKWVRDKIRYSDDYGVTEEYYKDNVIPYFEDMINNQRDEMIDEGRKLGITFKDAHGGNLGERKDGTLVYFDVGYADTITDMDTRSPTDQFWGSKPDLKDIRKVDLVNDFKKIKKMITSKYKKDTPILVGKVVSDISKLLGVNKVKAYKYLRDEAWSYKNKMNSSDRNNLGNFEYPIYFVYKPKNKEWEDMLDDNGDYKDYSNNKKPYIDPSWKRKVLDSEIFMTWTENYEKIEI